MLFQTREASKGLMERSVIDSEREHDYLFQLTISASPRFRMWIMSTTKEHTLREERMFQCDIGSAGASAFCEIRKCI